MTPRQILTRALNYDDWVAKITYTSQSGKTTTRLVSPYKLTVKGFSAMCLEDGGFKTFLWDGVESADLVPANDVLAGEPEARDPNSTD